MSRRGAHTVQSPVTYLVTLVVGIVLGAGAMGLFSHGHEATQATCEEHGRRCEERIQELERSLLAGIDQRLEQLPRPATEPASPPPAPEPVPPGEARRITYQGNTYDTYEVNLTQARVRFFFRRPDGTPFHSLGGVRDWLEARGERLVFATNAGMFTPEREPVGLYVEEGRELVELNTREERGNFFLKPNAVFFITRDGAGILESTAYKARSGPEVLYATQSGPALVLDGKLHPAFREGSSNLAPRRSGVGILAPDSVVFAIADQPVNRHQVASFFRDQLGCRDALYLDGVVSRMYLPALGREELDGDFGAMIGLSEPAP